MTQSLRDKLLIADTWPEKAAVIDEHVGTNIARLSTDASGNTALVGADGSTYAALPYDVNGDIIAHVSLRTGTLASLLALDGGNGEVSVATDTSALVLHNGVAGQAKSFIRSTKLAELHIHGKIDSLVGGTASVVNLTSATVNYGGNTVDLANDKFHAPVGACYAKMTLFANITDADVTAGTRLAAYVDYYVGGFGWSDAIGQNLFVANGYLQTSGDTVVVSGVSNQNYISVLDAAPTADDGYLRIRLLHNDATDAYAGVDVSAVFEFFGVS